MKKAKSAVGDHLRPEYRREDLGKGVRGKYFASYQKGSNLVLLNPDVAKAFPTSDAVTLEPEELAGVALELLTSSGCNEPSRLHPSSFTNPQTIGMYPESQRQEIEFALMEGWHWLFQEGLIAPHPGDTFGWHFITRRGKKIKNREGLEAYRNAVILPRRLLHPVIVQACWSAFLRGDYDTSVFQAFRELEVAIREAGQFKADDYGVDLARKAFHESSGPLTDQSKPVSERHALSHLVAGALRSYKNPHSHRKVELTAEEAVEMVILSSHLLKIVDARANHQTAARVGRKPRRGVPPNE